MHSALNWCKIDVFTSNIIVLHHKMSQTVKIEVIDTQTFIVYRMGRLCGGAHEILGIPAPL